MITGPVRIRTRVQSWTRVRIATCPVLTGTGQKPLPKIPLLHHFPQIPNSVSTLDFTPLLKIFQVLKNAPNDQIKNNIQRSGVACCSQDGAPLTCQIKEPNLSLNHFSSLISPFFSFFSFCVFYSKPSRYGFGFFFFLFFPIWLLRKWGKQIF